MFIIANIHEGHRRRLKKRFECDLMESFTEVQSLELLLFYAIPRRDTNEIAHALIAEFGNLSNVFEADIEELTATGGISENAAILIKMIIPLSKKYRQSKTGEVRRISSSEAAGSLVTAMYFGDTSESFGIISLDAQNKVIKISKISTGTVAEVYVSVRLVIGEALKYKANSIILCHNHPSESQKPSKADIDLTEKLARALKSVGINVVDHIIASGENYYSFADSGLIRCFDSD